MLLWREEEEEEKEGKKIVTKFVLFKIKHVNT